MRYPDKRLGAGYCLPLLAATVFLLSHFSGYIIPANYPVTFDLAVSTTPYGFLQNVVFHAHPEWMPVYHHATVRTGVFQNWVMMPVYCVQFAAAVFCLRRKV